MLHVTVSFEDRNHPGPWRLILDDGMALLRKECVHPGDQTEGLTAETIAEMVEENHLHPQIVCAHASPFDSPRPFPFK